MLGNNGTSEVGQVTIHTHNYRGHTPEELAEFALAKIINVGEKSHPVVLAQALAFKDNIRQILIHYMRMAQESQHGTIYGTLVKQGHEDLANVIKQAK